MRAESDRVAARVRELLGGDGPRVAAVPNRPAAGPVFDNDEGDPAGIAVARAGAPGHGTPTPWQRLAARLPVRVDPGRRTALLAGVAVLVVAIAAVGWLLTDRPQAMAVGAARSSVPASPLSSAGATGGGSPGAAVGDGATPDLAPPDGASSDVGTAASSSASTVVVDVAGKVRRPGVYQLAAGSRIDDALRAAGGALPGVGLNSLNLASKVIDGQQIAVGIAPASGAAAPQVAAGGTGGDGGAAAGVGATPAAGAPVDLNNATAEQLQTLPGVGPVLSQHIIDWRTAHGSFKSVAQLDDVPGIGTVKFGALHSLVSV